jgi:hypothetical protein
MRSPFVFCGSHEKIVSIAEKFDISLVVVMVLPFLRYFFSLKAAS